MVNKDYNQILGQKKSELAVLNSKIESNTRKIAELVKTLGLDPKDLTSSLASMKTDLEKKQADLESELTELLDKLPESAR